MDITMDNTLSFPLIVLSTITCLFLIIKITKPSSSSSKTLKNLPPGPPTLPIIGNLHQVGDKPHISTAHIARQYGPLISLRFGKQLIVVASTPEAAVGILKTQDRFLSSRIVPTPYKQSLNLDHSLMWTGCTEKWKNLKTLCRTEMFSTKALEAQSILREEKIGHMMDFLRRKQGQVVNIEDVVFTTLFNTLSSIVFAKDLINLKDDYGSSNELKVTIQRIVEFGSRILDLGSFHPILERFDLHGIKKGAAKEVLKACSYWEHVIEERRSQVNSSTWSSEQAQSLVDRLLENGFSNAQIHQLVMELFVAGTNTTTRTTVWVMSELLRHQEAMSKIEDEMNNEIKSGKINPSHLSKLPYLQACIKEAMRLNPPVPLLLPHLAADTCQVMGYTIPKNTILFVNQWAMGRDPDIWDDPLSFKPERFMGSKLDFKGQDFEFTPFGSGRRMCPGMPSATRSIEFILASLIHDFNWALPHGDDPSKLDMGNKLGLAMKREKPLKLVFKRK